MPSDRKTFHRKSIRLKGYDYSQAGLYFITICVQNRECLFGEIVGMNADSNADRPTARMVLNDAGKMVEREWLNLKNRFPNIELHEYVVMPNHFHGILQIVEANLVVAPSEVVVAAGDTSVGQPQGIAPTTGPTTAPTTGPTTGPTTEITPKNKTVGDMMDAFKSITTVEYIRGVKNLEWPRFNGKLWQRNYYEHIIRDERSYINITHYIVKNPSKWWSDKFYRK